jgi:hypothetical protein
MIRPTARTIAMAVWRATMVASCVLCYEMRDERTGACRGY